MAFLEILKSVIIGIIQGITEWLPISSTGHMILADEFLKLNVSKDFKDIFLVIIQFGSILAVLILYFKKLNPFRSENGVKSKEVFSLWAKIFAASIPAGVIGLLFDKLINNWFHNSVTVAATLIFYGIAFIFIENRKKRPRITSFGKLDYKTAFLIGVFQVLALIPGTSRSGATILGAVMLGMSRFLAAEFSFFLAIPVMCGASALKILKYYLKYGLNFTLNEWAVLFSGIIVAFIVSLFAIKFLMNYVKNHSFKLFGCYRILLGVVILAYFLIKVLL
ncbi:MAG: undecaprenyl-diphosphate phosphatase [Oscillospiraceae bacterium]|jgi:undecaprenyl-diphosphatase|nr:undecaprenyl-diphosphate phosphatase [Oscillospiraceae bacterium]